MCYLNINYHVINPKILKIDKFCCKKSEHICKLKKNIIEKIKKIWKNFMLTTN